MIYIVRTICFAMSYQRLDGYSGSLTGTPHFSGMEFDFEVPDNILVSSPGGVSATHHHFPGSMYSQNASSWDIYAGEEKRYPYGEHGNVYGVGHTAAQHLNEYALPVLDPMYTQNQSSYHVENFQGMSSSKGGAIGQTPVDIEFLAPPDTEEVTKDLKSDFKKLSHAISFPNPWVLLLLFVVAYIAMDFWVNAGEALLFDKFHGGKTPQWYWLAFYAAVFTFLIFLITSSLEVPLMALEKL